MWDEADYVVPPAENGAFFITTNVLVTPNQTQSRCPENIKVISPLSKTSTTSETENIKVTSPSQKIDVES